MDMTYFYWTLGVIVALAAIGFAVRFFRRLYVLVDETNTQVTQLRMMLGMRRQQQNQAEAEAQAQQKPSGGDLDYTRRYKEE